MAATDRCRSCRAPIVWARTPAGRLMPLDPTPTDDGNVEIIGGLAVVHHQPPLDSGHAHGEAHPNAKLTLADVRTIRSSGESQRVLAARYGVSRTLIRKVLSGEVWKSADATCPDAAEWSRR